MNVVVFELGERPALMTKGRVNAPQGARRLADLMANEKFAPEGLVITDWTGRYGDPEMRGPGLPRIILVVRFSPDNENYCIVSINVDLEDTFGRDTLDPADLVEIVQGLKRAVIAEQQRFAQGKVRHGVWYAHTGDDSTAS